MKTPGAAPPGALTRAAAARAVAEVLGRGRTLDAALVLVDAAELPAPDRAQARALAFGALRWHHRHRALIGKLLHQPLPEKETLLEALLSVGMFQLLDVTQPDHAAISATVDAARVLGRERATGLINATLRRLQRERVALFAAADVATTLSWSQPPWLVEQLREDWPDDWQSMCQAAQQPPPLWLRVNSSRTTVAACLARFAAAGLAARAGDTPHALRLDQPLPVAEIPGFMEGLLSVQDVASQLAAPLLGATAGQRVLDACAAPGGKATHLLELAAGGIDLLALDVDAQRLERVSQNLTRLGLGAELRVADATEPAAWWDGQPFDRILIDAPCSGTGVIRRHPDIKILRRESDIPGFAARQIDLLKALWPLLAPGGRLLYATCSVLRAENDAVVWRFLGEVADARLAPAPQAPPDWLRPCGNHGWQVLPGAADSDGLYYALMSRGPAGPDARAQQKPLTA